MKIAVLFGSFNPLTNAHVAALKTAVKKLRYPSDHCSLFTVHW